MFFSNKQLQKQKLGFKVNIKSSKGHNRALRFQNGGKEGDEARVAKKLGDENGGVALGLSTVDPLKTGTQNTRLTASLSQNAAPIATH
ncbi:hypothetical protein SLEP1_g8958 [Rubroshorea leprosula]|uniref:Uncharacterized protein n=1 Tax=Rubroshorea leprosula TaxID=152421 RepID=A0AAV5IDB5_9ROSI|nr:hypothetical protein SLEP1_g8958 [Rubroshorea leprosula]